ncbi:hypothetical protein CPT03_13655 [Pedobacter ginsengisoli]|uniref:Phytanoyl-CoA dioxygenase n=1 Tax=Pedobacter ginsengisoli TaxID=363852 RepID=A0A2D1U782_9SPHI|nr:phytanoyl-CoA dioxygenase family protein [Pedobacter ginsengisoli]ATP57442.1 hypothetical protein CPT03_13655 [Pedobacter ginsengisoli]
MNHHEEFISLFYEMHKNKKLGNEINLPPGFENTETVWMNFYGLGKFETLSFMYMECRDVEHFRQWITDLKGNAFVEQATLRFNSWSTDQQTKSSKAPVYPKTLSEEQLQFWETFGYIRIPGAVESSICNQVRQQICEHLNIEIDQPQTWYQKHPDLQGIMVQLYQNEQMEKVRYHPRIKEIFAELYQTDQLIPTTEKVGFNPPETDEWKLRNGSLHWDINFEAPIGFHIQGLVYLDEVPQERGPLMVVPGFHLRFKDWIKPFASLEKAQEYMLATETSSPVSGQRGDLILWQNTIPHSAGRNQSTLPRFVQYVSFAKL